MLVETSIIEAVDEAHASVMASTFQDEAIASRLTEVPWERTVAPSSSYQKITVNEIEDEGNSWKGNCRS